MKRNNKMKSVFSPLWLALLALLVFLPACGDDFEETDLTGTGAEIAIGDRLYAVVGDTLRVYFYSVVVNPRADNYILALECEKGKHYERCWTYVPTSGDVGECEMNLSIYDYNGQLLDAKQVTLVTREARNPASRRHLLCLGNSLVLYAYSKRGASGKFPHLCCGPGRLSGKCPHNVLEKGKGLW